MKIFGDPEAADIVFTSGADILAVGINVTHQVIMTGTPVCMFCSTLWTVWCRAIILFDDATTSKLWGSAPILMWLS